MNRKRRNEHKLIARESSLIIGLDRYEGWIETRTWIGFVRNYEKKAETRVNRNRKAARLRRLYHRCADWICPSYSQNTCKRCKYLRRCAAHVITTYGRTSILSKQVLINDEASRYGVGIYGKS